MAKGRRLCGVLELRISIQSAKDSLIKITIAFRYHIRSPQLEESPTMNANNITEDIEIIQTEVFSYLEICQRQT